MNELKGVLLVAYRQEDRSFAGLDTVRYSLAGVETKPYRDDIRKKPDDAFEPFFIPAMHRQQHGQVIDGADLIQEEEERDKKHLEFCAVFLFLVSLKGGGEVFGKGYDGENPVQFSRPGVFTRMIEIEMQWGDVGMKLPGPKSFVFLIVTGMEISMCVFQEITELLPFSGQRVVVLGFQVPHDQFQGFAIRVDMREIEMEVFPGVTEFK